jgi:hypothetical protein
MEKAKKNPYCLVLFDVEIAMQWQWYRDRYCAVCLEVNIIIKLFETKKEKRQSRAMHHLHKVWK